MTEDPQNGPNLGYYAMIQIGLEMAAPVALGVWLDGLWAWFPWLTALGALLGFSLGLWEIYRINQDKGKDSDDKGRAPP